MDRQAILDTVIERLHAQGAPGRQANGIFYHTADGRKTALGCLIPDALYNDAIEDRDPDNLPLYIYDEIGAEGGDDIAFLADLEGTHNRAAAATVGDVAAFWPAWLGELGDFAAAHGLSLARAAALGAPTPPEKPEFDPLTVARLGRPPLIIPR